MGYSTGNTISDQIGQLNFTGNVIPSVWFQTVVSSAGRPNLLACQLLSEIVYWYRPSEVRDQQTGQFIGYRTKFKGDLLQKSYQSLADLYHVSKRQVMRAIVFLEKEIQVLKRVFRSVPGKDGMIYNNVLYIWLDTERLKELTFPPDQEEPELPSGIDYDDEPVMMEESSAQSNVDNVDSVDKDTPLLPNLVGPSCQKLWDPPTKFGKTNTENTTEITNSYNYQSALSCHEEPGRSRDSPDGLGQTEQDQVDFDELIRSQVSYDTICEEYKDGQETGAIDVLDTCVSVAASVYRHTGRYLQVAGERMPINLAVSLVKKMNIFHARHIIKAFLDVENEIKNVRAYMLACIFNEIRTLPAQEANIFSYNGRGMGP